MKVEKVLEENLKREFNVTVPAENLESQIQEKLMKISKEANMPGFRPGKVPLDIVRKKHGQEVMGEVLQSVVADTSKKTLEENALKPAMQPDINIKEFEEGKDLVYSMSFEIMPDIPEVDYSAISLNRYIAKIEDQDINSMLEKVAEQRKNFESLQEDRPSKEGDALIIDFKGFINGEAFEGGEAKDFQLELGSGAFIPGFEDQLIGKNKGDEVSVNITFPEDYQKVELAGKETVFEVIVKDVKEAKEAEIDDKFAQEIGFENLVAMKEAVSQQLESDAGEMTRVMLKKDFFDYIDENYDVDLPEKMIEQELNSIIQQVKSSQDPEYKDKSDDEIKEEFDDLAKRRVKLGIIISELGARSGIKIQGEDVNKAIVEEAKRYTGQEQQVVEYYQNNAQARESLNGIIMEEKTVDFIFDKIQINDSEKPYDEIREMVLEDNKD